MLENVKTGLENRVAELEDEKGNLLLSVLDVDDFKGSYNYTLLSIITKIIFIVFNFFDRNKSHKYKVV